MSNTWAASEFDGDFPGYLDALLKMRWPDGNVAVQAATGVHHSMIGKWRNGLIKPTIERLRPIAKALGIPPAYMFIRAGLLEPSDLDIPALYVQLAEIDARHTPEHRQEMRNHLEYLMRVEREKASSAQAPRDPRQGRSA